MALVGEQTSSEAVIRAEKTEKKGCVLSSDRPHSWPGGETSYDAKS